MRKKVHLTLYIVESNYTSVIIIPHQSGTAHQNWGILGGAPFGISNVLRHHGGHHNTIISFKEFLAVKT